MPIEHDPQHGIIVTTEHDAARVGRAADALAGVLLEMDPRVQAAWAEWLTRMTACEKAGDFTDARVELELAESLRLLAVLVTAIGLGRFRWLPMALLRAFARRLEADAGTPGAASAWTLSVPPGLSWAAVRRAPKNGPNHQDDLARDARWWYRTQVREPRESQYRIALEQEKAKGTSQEKSYVRNRVKSFGELLEAID